MGRFEELGSAIQTVATRMGLPSAHLGVHNSSESDRPPGDLIQDDYQFLHELYRRDFEMFGYDPDLRL